MTIHSLNRFKFLRIKFTFCCDWLEYNDLKIFKLNLVFGKRENPYILSIFKVALAYFTFILRQKLYTRFVVPSLVDKVHIFNRLLS